MNRLNKAEEEAARTLEASYQTLIDLYAKAHGKSLEEAKAAKKQRFAILSENGEVLLCDLATWSASMQHGYRVIRQEKLGERYVVSTVFLGLNHQPDPFRKPHWFETMIFDEHQQPVHTERCSTFAEALEQHQKAKESLRT